MKNVFWPTILMSNERPCFLFAQIYSYIFLFFLITNFSFIFSPEIKLNALYFPQFSHFLHLALKKELVILFNLIFSGKAMLNEKYVANEYMTTTITITFQCISGTTAKFTMTINCLNFERFPQFLPIFIPKILYSDKIYQKLPYI